MDVWTKRGFEKEIEELFEDGACMHAVVQVKRYLVNKDNGWVNIGLDIDVWTQGIEIKGLSSGYTLKESVVEERREKKWVKIITGE